MELRGKVKSGLGNAAFWVEKINKIFEERFGIRLFLGTLNIELDKPYVLEGKEKILPNEYGGKYEVIVQEASLFGHKVYILRSENNNKKGGDHSLRIIEVASDANLRETYNLKNEDEVIIKILLDKREIMA